ncbi:MAG TPA: 2-amino-4-hydroxy-6-hydroxymethyldihydropteridine diphosphokinase, partial [bacterium]|nr:2-amino-4-hydroxy-6-hydroxymethyldihydropteridine diphosphokinase [bacterium]
MNTVFIGIGSNLGDALTHCEGAVSALRRIPEIPAIRVSGWYRTEPFGTINQPWFINGVAVMKTTLQPLQLLDICLSLELQHGRNRGSHWGPRTLDLDLLLWENRVMTSARLVIPHPWMHRRRFVLLPLCDLAPDWRHPLLNATMKT